MCSPLYTVTLQWNEETAGFLLRSGICLQGYFQAGGIDSPSIIFPHDNHPKRRDEAQAVCIELFTPATSKNRYENFVSVSACIGYSAKLINFNRRTQCIY